MAGRLTTPHSSTIDQTLPSTYPLTCLDRPEYNLFLYTFSKMGGHDVAVRIQALPLWEFGMPVAEVSKITGISIRTIYNLKTRAVSRGYDPEISQLLKLEYLEDGTRTGHPKTMSAEREQEVRSTPSPML